MTTHTLPALKKRAAAVGLRFHKSTWRRGTSDNEGGYQVVDTERRCVADGSKFDLDLDGVAEVIEQWGG